MTTQYGATSTTRTGQRSISSTQKGAFDITSSVKANTNSRKLFYDNYWRKPEPAGWIVHWSQLILWAPRLLPIGAIYGPGKTISDMIARRTSHLQAAQSRTSVTTTLHPSASN